MNEFIENEAELKESEINSIPVTETIKKPKHTPCKFYIDENGNPRRIGSGGTLKGHCKGRKHPWVKGAPKGHPLYPGSGFKKGVIWSTSFKKGHKIVGNGRPRMMSIEDENKLAEDLIKWMMEDGNVFYTEFLLKRGIYRKWLAYAKEKNPVLNEAYERAREIQELKLMKGATLDSSFNANFTKFVLANKHKENWAEKTETKITGTLEHTASVFLGAADGKTKDLIDEEKI